MDSEQLKKLCARIQKLKANVAECIAKAELNEEQLLNQETSIARMFEHTAQALQQMLHNLRSDLK